MAGLLTMPSCLQSVFGSLLTAANLTSLLGLPQTNYTIFAPVNSAFLAAITRGNITCVTNYYIEQPCPSTTSLLQADNLPQIVLNHGPRRGGILAAWAFCGGASGSAGAVCERCLWACCCQSKPLSALQLTLTA